MTTPQPPAVRLRAAAALVWGASAAALGSDESWHYAKGSPNDSVRTSVGWEVATSDNPNNLRWIALVGPAVGEPLAGWLETVAELHEQPTHRGQVSSGCQWCADEDWPCADMRGALAVADALLAVTR